VSKIARTQARVAGNAFEIRDTGHPYWPQFAGSIGNHKDVALIAVELPKGARLLRESERIKGKCLRDYKTVWCMDSRGDWTECCGSGFFFARSTYAVIDKRQGGGE